MPAAGTGAKQRIRERGDGLDHITQGSRGIVIPGRKGFLSRAEQEKLAKEWFEQGGRLPDGRPWDQLPHKTRELLREQFIRSRISRALKRQRKKK